MAFFGFLDFLDLDFEFLDFWLWFNSGFPFEGGLDFDIYWILFSFFLSAISSPFQRLPTPP